jgi:hypothetical protein
MMIMRVLRVLGAHQLGPIFNVSRSRSISNSLPRLNASEEPLPWSGTSASESVVENLKKVQQAIKGSKDPEEPVSKPHWALAEGYEAGGRLKSGGKDPLNRFDEEGLPRWGDWGIVIRLQISDGTSILSLSVALP